MQDISVIESIKLENTEGVRTPVTEKRLQHTERIPLNRLAETEAAGLANIDNANTDGGAADGQDSGVNVQTNGAAAGFASGQSNFATVYIAALSVLMVISRGT